MTKRTTRRLTYGGGALLAIAALAGCAAGAPAEQASTAAEQASTAAEEAPAAGNVVVVDGGGSYHDVASQTILPAFTKATGIDATAASYDFSLGAIQAQMEGAKDWDVVMFAANMPEEMQAQMFLPLDRKIVTGEGVPEGLINDYLIGSSINGFQVTYRTDAYPGAKPQTWADVWDCDTFPGTRQMMNWPAGTLEAALLADGVAAKDLYPLDLDRAFASLDKLVKKCDVVWYNTGADQIQNFANGVATIGMGWNGRVYQAQQEGVDIEASMEQTILAPTRWGVLKTSKNPEAAMKFIQWDTSPEGNALEATAYPGQVPVNSGAFDSLDPKLAETLPTNPKYADTVVPTDLAYLDASFPAMYDRWQTWFTGIS